MQHLPLPAPAGKSRELSLLSPCWLAGPLTGQWVDRSAGSPAAPHLPRGAFAASSATPPPPRLGHAQCSPGVLGGRLEAGGSQGTLATREFGTEATFPELAFLPRDPEPRQARPPAVGAGSGDADASASEVCGLGAWGETEQRAGCPGGGVGVNQEDRGGLPGPRGLASLDSSEK